MPAELVGAPEAAVRLGMTSERVRQLAKAGELPAPAGRVGRQDVWVWHELLDWAIAQGRLDPAAGEERQRVRAWAPGEGRRTRVVDDVMHWEGGRGHVHVRIWEATDDAAEPPVVVIGNLEDSRGQSATNAIEEVAMLVAARYLGRGGLQAQFYDHWSRSPNRTPSFDHVTFTIRPADRARRWRHSPDRASIQALGAALTDPSWRATTAAEIEKLVGESLEVYTPGTYTASMVRAVHSAGGQPVDATWDPEGAALAAHACLWLTSQLPGHPPPSLAALEPVGSVLLARCSVDAFEKAAADLAWQDPDAPVRLHLPVLPQAEELRRLADRAAHDVPHRTAWEVVGVAREHLAHLDPAERLLLADARGGGLSRLPWWEAGVPEPRNPRQGMIGPIVTEQDLRSMDAGHPAVTEIELLRAVERAAVRFLDAECSAADDWDVPQYRVAGAYPAGGPLAARFLEAVRWGPTPEPMQHRERRLLRLLEADAGPSLRRRTAPEFGLHPSGCLVARSSDGRRFALEWPNGPSDELLARREDLMDATVRADSHRDSGAQPVWLEFANGTVEPLPSRAGWASTHEYSWGYHGTGPTNLSDALTDLAVMVVDDPAKVDVDALAATNLVRVSSGRTPAWRVRDLLPVTGDR